MHFQLLFCTSFTSFIRFHRKDFAKTRISIVQMIYIYIYIYIKLNKRWKLFSPRHKLHLQTNISVTDTHQQNILLAPASSYCSDMNGIHGRFQHQRRKHRYKILIVYTIQRWFYITAGTHCLYAEQFCYWCKMS